jgi:dTDP-4-amino-4,6-dideoxygalactose transaminase
VAYNSWPLGLLPKEWQRPEPNILKEQGYNWNDPREIVGIFEKKLAEYAGSKFAVVVDSCSNAIFLSLQYRIYKGDLKLGEKIVIPEQTYVSVPMQILHSRLMPVLESRNWSGIYELINADVFDSAARFTKNMFVGENSLQALSFQIKKRLPIGKGGAILTNSPEAYEWLKLSSYDGRNLESPYNSSKHVEQIGWHYYMTPEDAARGILLMDKLPIVNDDTMDFNHYPSLVGYKNISHLLIREIS